MGAQETVLCVVSTGSVNVGVVQVGSQDTVLRVVSVGSTVVVNRGFAVQMLIAPKVTNRPRIRRNFIATLLVDYNFEIGQVWTVLRSLNSRLDWS